ncbi:MAG: hypothetical protein ACPLZD_07415 [Candidatus Saccharicenans sp.]|nr:MAG: hypothetical protein C0168_01970 [Candidatus Aminicenantes bacterium]HEK85846.1 hypothetical protein [Candidatus Aminicenantes bacterium]
MFRLAIVLALVFSPVAALSSYLITYAEYKRHFPEDLRRARKFSLTFALMSFIFFTMMIILAVIFIDKFLPK